MYARPARAELFRVFNDVVVLFARPDGCTGNDDGFDHAAFFDGIGKHRERAAFKLRSQVNKFHAEPQVRFVGAEPVHCVVITHSLKMDVLGASYPATLKHSTINGSMTLNTSSGWKSPFRCQFV